MVKGGVWWSCAAQVDSACVCVILYTYIDQELEGQRSVCPEHRESWTSAPSVDLLPPDMTDTVIFCSFSALCLF